jgi:hypothetical protein
MAAVWDIRLRYYSSAARANRKTAPLADDPFHTLPIEFDVHGRLFAN